MRQKIHDLWRCNINTHEDWSQETFLQASLKMKITFLRLLHIMKQDIYCYFVISSVARQRYIIPILILDMTSNEVIVVI